jgi:hypothetical protein
MGKFIQDREIERYDDGLNTTYFLHGPEPKPKVFIDDTTGIYYFRFAKNAQGEDMYFMRGLNDA